MMIRVIFLCLVCFLANAQDIPLFTQKLTNSFLYNPATAGLDFGSITYSYRQNFAAIKNSPESHFVSVHSPLWHHRYGTGFNIYNETVNLTATTYASGAAAKHFSLNKTSALSVGISGEYINIRANRKLNFNGYDKVLEDLINNPVSNVSFSAGILYYDKFLRLGFAANRISVFSESPDIRLYDAGYSSTAQFMIPVRRSKDLVEPYISVRRFSRSSVIEVGAYYTYSSLLTLGASTRAGRVMALTAAFKISPRIVLGYTTETYTGSVRGYAGLSHEIVFRRDFAFRQGKKSTDLLRRKRILTKKVSARSPEEFHRKNERFLRKARRSLKK